jgi:DNA polymerase (family 10)
VLPPLFALTQREGLGEHDKAHRGRHAQPPRQHHRPPPGRLLGQRDGVEMDVEAVINEAARTGTMLEVNAQPNRLDLDGELGRRAVKAGVVLALGSDAHHAQGLGVMRFGVVTARRGWAEPANVANSFTCAEFLARLRSGKA